MLKIKLIAVLALTAVIALVCTCSDAMHADVAVNKAQAPAETTVHQLSDEEREAFLRMLGNSGNVSGSSKESNYVFKYGNQKLTVPLSYEVAMYAVYKAQQYNIDPDLLFCVMWRESNFKADAIGVNTNGTCDYGLMQINEVNYSLLHNKVGLNSVYDLLNPYTNIDCGTYFLSYYINKYGTDYHKVLMCYNLGEGGAKRKWANGIYTTYYSESVLNRMEYYYYVVYDDQAPVTTTSQAQQTEPETTIKQQNKYVTDRYNTTKKK